MPIIKAPRTREPLWREWDYKARRKGVCKSIYNNKGDSYAGAWLDNKKHGKGTYKWKDTGVVYEGDWENDKRNGAGTISKQDGKGSYKKIYTGGWKNDLRHGFGTEFYSDSEYYEGEWFAGKRSGWGRMFYADGTLYEGEWSADKRNGQGMFRGNNDDRFEGTWKDDKKNGFGKYYYLGSGQVLEGMWKDDVPRCGTMQDFGRDKAPEPTPYPIPDIELADPMGVIAAATLSLVHEREIEHQKNQEN